uniref:Uncharacterized protein MANES_17G064900 n=1 Tax=Rhizophora mucronata TaxID=61149 RepID=A0A2P2LAV0_RHIMU
MQAASLVVHFYTLPATSCSLVVAPFRSQCHGMGLTPFPMQLTFKSLHKPCVCENYHCFFLSFFSKIRIKGSHHHLEGHCNIQFHKLSILIWVIVFLPTLFC